MIKYNEKKPKNQEGFQYIDKHLSEKSSNRYKSCGSWIEMFSDIEMEKMKVHNADFCKNRFCPMCQWRSAKKDAMQVSVLMDYIGQEHGKNFIFVTLTAPNVIGDELKSEITKYNKAFKKLVERDEISRINQGYIRKLEVTYNKIQNTYHPHFHCIFAVNKSYFTDRTYVKQQRWLELWKEVMGDDTITQVDIRRVRRSKDGNEIAKYAAKSSDYLISQDIFDVFYGALKGRQLITFNNIFAQANKKYKAKELDIYKTRDEAEYVYLILYQWGGQAYLENRIRRIDEHEYKELKKLSVDESSLG